MTGPETVVQRYYASTTGRFLTPDPYKATTKSTNNPEEPQSWNRYAYVLGDAVNGRDPRGLMVLGPEDGDLEDWEFEETDPMSMEPEQAKSPRVRRYRLG